MKQKELKIRKSEEKSAIILISGSAGELDWILPILDHLLRNRFRLQVLFLTRHARKSVKENYTLEDFLVGRSNGVVVTSVGGAVFEYLERSSYLVHRARLKLRADKNQFLKACFQLCDFMFSGLFFWRLSVVLRLDGSDQYLFFSEYPALRRPRDGWLKTKFKRSVFFYCPHSPHIYANNLQANYTDDDVIDFEGREFLLLGHPADYSAINDGRELAAPGLQKLYIGHPKYSESWLKPLIKKASDFAETAVSRQKTSILVLSRGYGSYLDATSHVELVEETVAAIQYTLQNFQILVKKHPREVDSHWDVLARENDYIEIVYDHMLQIATRADFVVTFWGSGAMDCYRLGLPIIEFWDPNALSKDQVKVQDGYTTIYRLLGIVLPVESRGELQQAIELLSRGDQKFGQRSPHPYFVELIDRSNEWDNTIDRILQAHKFV